MSATKNLLGYSASATQLTCSIASLAAGSTRESATQSNTTNLFFDYQVTLTFTIATGGPATSTQMSVNLYANGSNDSTLWPIIQLSSGATYQTGGGDASVGALASPSNKKLIGSFGLQSTTSSAERTFRTDPFSVAAAFGGVIPQAFSIFVENQFGISFSTSTVTTANYLEIEGVYSTSGN